MPYIPHHRITFSGVLGTVLNPVETFAFTLAMVHLQGGPADPIAIWTDVSMTALRTAATNFFGHLDTRIHSDAKLTELKVAYIGADGRTPRDATGAYEQRKDVISAGVAGGSSGTLFPYQTALAVSLMTPRAGRQGKGRFYLPAPTHPVTSGTGVIGTATRDLTLARVKVLIDDLNNIHLSHRVGVASNAGANSVVHGVRIGRVLDTIRSRRRGLVEDYAATPIDFT